MHGADHCYSKFSSVFDIWRTLSFAFPHRSYLRNDYAQLLNINLVERIKLCVNTMLGWIIIWLHDSSFCGLRKD